MRRLPDDVTPLSYTMDEEGRRLLIDWSDDHASVHSYEALRRGCPCAWCAGEGAQKGSVDAETRFSVEQTTLYEVQPVGRYGLTPVWGDGHHTGIYTYERLRATCECDECRAARDTRGAY
ncbi:MAG TPA: DUF971 domain-containing protein [Ktedonobacterales bacterium]